MKAETTILNNLKTRLKSLNTVTYIITYFNVTAWSIYTQHNFKYIVQLKHNPSTYLSLLTNVRSEAPWACN